MKIGKGLGVILIVLLTSLNSTCQVIQKKNINDSIYFSQEEVNKIADIIFELDYLKAINASLYQEQQILSVDRDRAYKGILDCRTVVSLKDSIINKKEQQNNNWKKGYEDLDKKLTKKDTWLYIETTAIVILVFKIIFFK